MRGRSLRLETLESRHLLHAAPLMALDVPAEGEADNPGLFQLEDVNETSSTLGQLVSPEDFTGQVSGWYFGFAT